MPLASEDVLNSLIEATREAKQTIRELHESRAAALDVIKKQKKVITDQIVTEITSQIETISDEAKEQMHEKINKVIDNITMDWREKLGL